MHELLKHDAIVRNNFVLNRKLLSQFRLDQLVLAKDQSEADLGIEFALMLYRTDKHTVLDEIVTDPHALKLLQKRDSIGLWNEFERQKQERAK